MFQRIDLQVIERVRGDSSSHRNHIDKCPIRELKGQNKNSMSKEYMKINTDRNHKDKPKLIDSKLHQQANIDKLMRCLSCTMEHHFVSLECHNRRIMGIKQVVPHIKQMSCLVLLGPRL